MKPELGPLLWSHPSLRAGQVMNILFADGMENNRDPPDPPGSRAYLGSAFEDFAELEFPHTTITLAKNDKRKLAHNAILSTRADPGPEMFAREIPFLAAQPGNHNGTFPFQKSNH